jgi:hypothetical protein
MYAAQLHSANRDNRHSACPDVPTAPSRCDRSDQTFGVSIDTPKATIRGGEKGLAD